MLFLRIYRNLAVIRRAVARMAVSGGGRAESNGISTRIHTTVYSQHSRESTDSVIVIHGSRPYVWVQLYVEEVYIQSVGDTRSIGSRGVRRSDGYDEILNFRGDSVTPRTPQPHTPDVTPICTSVCVKYPDVRRGIIMRRQLVVIKRVCCLAAH